jgi:hypothetical protein
MVLLTNLKNMQAVTHAAFLSPTHWRNYALNHAFRYQFTITLSFIQSVNEPIIQSQLLRPNWYHPLAHSPDSLSVKLSHCLFHFKGNFDKVVRGQFCSYTPVQKGRGKITRACFNVPSHNLWPQFFFSFLWITVAYMAGHFSFRRLIDE